LRRAELENQCLLSIHHARVLKESSESDQQQLSISMRPYTRHLDIEAQQMRGPGNDQLLHRMVRAMRKVSPLLGM